jgi:hypothetical protein
MDNTILVEFREESKQILAELEEIVEKMEDDQTCKGNENFTGFSQRIDRIMGASKTIALLFPFNPGLKEIGKITALCKAMGYKAVETDSPALVPIFCGFWADSIEVLNDVINSLENANEVDRIVGDFVPVVRKRLEWLSSKLKIVEPAKKVNTNELNDMLNNFFK